MGSSVGRLSTGRIVIPALSGPQLQTLSTDEMRQSESLGFTSEDQVFFPKHYVETKMTPFKKAERVTWGLDDMLVWCNKGGRGPGPEIQDGVGSQLLTMGELFPWCDCDISLAIQWEFCIRLSPGALHAQTSFLSCISVLLVSLAWALFAPARKPSIVCLANLDNYNIGFHLQEGSLRLREVDWLTHNHTALSEKPRFNLRLWLNFRAPIPNYHTF